MSAAKHKGLTFSIQGQKPCIRKRCTGLMVPVLIRYTKPHPKNPDITIYKQGGLTPEWECCKCESYTYRYDPKKPESSATQKYLRN